MVEHTNEIKVFGFGFRLMNFWEPSDDRERNQTVIKLFTHYTSLGILCTVCHWTLMEQTLAWLIVWLNCTPLAKDISRPWRSRKWQQLYCTLSAWFVSASLNLLVARDLSITTHSSIAFEKLTQQGWRQVYFYQEESTAYAVNKDLFWGI